MARKRRGNGSGSLFKRNASGAWIGAWYTHDGRRREKSTGTTDRAAAQRILSKWVADAALRRGVNVYRGQITNAAVAGSLGRPYAPIEDLVGNGE